jgi:tetratricopeptide (TPR) repeat protein
MGICYTALGRYKDALVKIKEALKLDKNLTLEEHYWYGEVCAKLKDSKKAIKNYKGSTTVDPVVAIPNMRLGMLYLKLKSHKDAVAVA